MAKRSLEIAKAVIKRDDVYLLGKREAGAKSYPETWDFFGGQLDPGETPTESVVRETMEETSLIIEPGERVIELQFEDENHILKLHYFSPGVEPGDIKLSSEHTEYGWFTKEKTHTMETHPSVSEFFKH